MKASTRLTEVLSESEQLAASSAAYVDASLTGEGTAAPDDAPDTRKILIREPQSALIGRDTIIAPLRFLTQIAHFVQNALSIRIISYKKKQRTVVPSHSTLHLPQFGCQCKCWLNISSL